MDEKILEAEKYFNCEDSERIAFEVGIKLGALFHQFVGTPVSSKNIEKLESAMESTTESQAFVRAAEVKIKPEQSSNSERGPFDYTTLTGDMIEAKVEVKYKGIEAVGKMEYIESMNYPLMYLESLKM
ncbi:MAG: dihydroneopterin aldolase family protein [Candidatus Thermoplasmatota archaeon]|nr:dihydroneopterin aldolase family protein [Candidatus Thermoplasmatota archaeon]MBS3790298.1 dihydroneopterin aldolase family protein [Candidatus Thermoplasmatota archaeon]